MTAFSAQIAASSDDADQSTGTVALTGNVLNCNSPSQYIGLRFTNVTIPAGSTINNATFTAYLISGSYDDPDLDIYADDVDSATTFTTSSNNISSRTPTTATVTWTATSIGTGNKTSPDIKSVIQEIIDRPGWSSGNNIALILHGRSSSSNYRIRTYDYGSDHPQIDIDYTAGGGSAQPPRTMHQTRMKTP